MKVEIIILTYCLFTAPERALNVEGRQTATGRNRKLHTIPSPNFEPKNLKKTFKKIMKKTGFFRRFWQDITSIKLPPLYVTDIAVGSCQ